MQQLKAALEAREQAHNLMKSLEQSHAQGRVDAARYAELRAQYAQRIADASNELQRARTRVQAQLLAAQARGREAERRARDLGVRVMIGEFDASTAEARRQEYAQDVARSGEEAARLTTALAAESPAGVILPDAPVVARVREPEAPEWAEEIATRLTRLPGADWMTRRVGNAFTLAGAAIIMLSAGVLPYWWASLVLGAPHYTLAQLSPVLAALILILAVGAATALGLTHHRTRAALQALLVAGMLACWLLTLFDVGTPTIQSLLETAKAAGTVAANVRVPFIEDQSASPAMADALKSILLHKAVGCFLLPLGAFLILFGASAQARNRRAGRG